MVNPNRAAMNAALKNSVVPVLRQMGFTGSLPHFRRRLPDRIDLLTFQFNRHGGSFVVEIAKCNPEGITMPWGEQIPSSKVTAHDISEPRPRLCPSPDDENHWFVFDNGQTPDDAVAELLPLLASRAEPWWNGG